MSKCKAYISMPRHNGERFAKLMVREFEQMSAMVDNVGKSRWAELFGTPERAAQTFEDFCDKCDKGECNDCPLDKLTDFCIGYDSLLEWLRGDAE